MFSHTVEDKNVKEAWELWVREVVCALRECMTLPWNSLFNKHVFRCWEHIKEKSIPGQSKRNSKK